MDLIRRKDVDVPCLNGMHPLLSPGKHFDFLVALQRERRPPDRIGPILLLHHLSTSNLTELHIDDLGMNVRYGANSFSYWAASTQVLVMPEACDVLNPHCGWRHLFVWSVSVY
eukprot:1157738-Pelagomonas_calceolata.AAC.1